MMIELRDGAAILASGIAIGTNMGKLTSIGSRLRISPNKLRAAPKVAERFYESREWRGLIASIKAERGNWCERCGSRHRVIGDHIVERKDGGADLDPDNVELLCAAHHNEKTARERAKRAQGQR